MYDSVQLHRRQPTRLPRPWDSPGKNTGVGCHFFLQCMKVKSEREATQSCPTLHDPMDCSLPGSSVHGIFQARGLEWGVISFSKLQSYQILNSKQRRDTHFMKKGKHMWNGRIRALKKICSYHKTNKDHLFKKKKKTLKIIKLS